MTSYAMPETISAESFEALESSTKEHFCAKCIDRDCETSSHLDFPQPNNSETLEKSRGGDILRACGGHPTVLSGGFPCQPVSLTGSRKGSDDFRWLWPEYLRLIQECKPAWIVAENVAQLFSIPEFRQISADLQKEGYRFNSYIIRAADTGAPHLRARAFVVAHTDSNTGHKENSGINPLGDITETREKRARHNVMWRNRPQIPLPDWSFNPPKIHRVDDGFSRKLDKPRLQALGNAIVPRVAFPIFEAIAKIEGGLTNEKF